MGGRSTVTEAIVALGMTLSGSVIVAAWMVSAIPNRDAPAISRQSVSAPAISHVQGPGHRQRP